jgi:hypothetical protein
MTELRRLEASPPANPLDGGALITYPSGHTQQLHWHSDGRLILPTRDAAKQYAISALQKLLDERRTDDAERTNWPSLIAALERILIDFNEILRAHLVARGPISKVNGTDTPSIQ